MLYPLGLFCYGGMSKGIDGIRWLACSSALPSAISAPGSAFVFLGRKARIGLCAAWLLGYWALMSSVPVPGFGAGDFAETRNLANWVDANFLAGFKWDGNHDPEGLLTACQPLAVRLVRESLPASG